MKKILCLTALAVALCASPSFARTAANTASPTAATSAATPASAAPSSAMSPQNTRMKDCAAQYHAQNLPKNQYRTFMKSCLKTSSGSAATPASTTTVAKPVTSTAAPAPVANAPSGMTAPTAPATPSSAPASAMAPSAANPASSPAKP